jgi:hypothetical protein
MAIVEHEVMTERAAELDEASRILLHAAALIRSAGWTQWKTCDERTGAMCTGAAITLAETGVDLWPIDHGDNSPSMRKFVKALGGPGGVPSRFIANWNDQEGRTAEEVVEALERAAYGV